MKRIPLIDYLKSKGIDQGRVVRRYIYFLKMLHFFQNKNNLSELVVVNGNNLMEAIADYFVDIVRMKEFHPIEIANKEKVIGYEAYWLLKRKPLQVVKDFDGCDSINEYFITEYITSAVLKEKKIDNTKKNTSSFSRFYYMLFYNLKYRLVTQKSLELMIDSFYAGCDVGN